MKSPWDVPTFHAIYNIGTTGGGGGGGQWKTIPVYFPLGSKLWVQKCKLKNLGERGGSDFPPRPPASYTYDRAELMESERFILK